MGGSGVAGARALVSTLALAATGETWRATACRRTSGSRLPSVVRSTRSGVTEPAAGGGQDDLSHSRGPGTRGGRPAALGCVDRESGDAET